MTTLRENTLNRQIPDRLYMAVPGIPENICRLLAMSAQAHAKRLSPKLTGNASNRMEPIWGEGYFGLRWMDPYLWYQEIGIRPFTMNKLAGKTIPMWIDDPTGKVAQENPKAKTRTTMSGKRQVLIFRRAARHGQRKTVERNGQRVDVPASYPGAPGRINVREARSPYTRPGHVGGQIARFNVGVRWRHPGLAPRSFLFRGMVLACNDYGIQDGEVVATTSRWGVT